jgi:UDP-glucose 4-epimerase
MARYFIVGGAGFIGSHFCDHLMSLADTSAVTIYDNFTSGRDWHVAHHLSDPRFSIARGEISDSKLLTEAMAGHDVVIHLASNPDIAKAVTEPDIDFREGTLLTNNVLEAMRLGSVPRILYASGSGVYGDTGELVVHEDHSPIKPISTYGASKLGCEALISAYSFMFGIRGVCFRFGNVVGPRQTHGVGFDFVRRLRADGTHLRILGDGRQDKSYIHVSDVIAAVMWAHVHCKEDFEVFNVATGDTITVNDIADLCCEVVGLAPHKVRYEYTGGDRGWKGDVPVIRLDISRIRALGWPGARPTRVALKLSLEALNSEAVRGLI